MSNIGVERLRNFKGAMAGTIGLWQGVRRRSGRACRIRLRAEHIGRFSGPECLLDQRRWSSDR
jgi:hypothetical protein